MTVDGGALMNNGHLYVSGPLPIRDERWVRCSGATVRVSANKTFALAREKDSELVAKVIFEVNETGVRVYMLGACIPNVFQCVAKIGCECKPIKMLKRKFSLKTGCLAG